MRKIRHAPDLLARKYCEEVSALSFSHAIIPALETQIFRILHLTDEKQILFSSFSFFLLLLLLWCFHSHPDLT
jgi:hypothetical protein